jgi:signal transduction histidine kinase
MELKTNEVSAVIDLKLLPDIIGYEKQIKILFTEIITNALKFRRADVKPIITISCQTTGGFELVEISPHLNNKQFFRVEVSDNGIGFDKQFTEKMFMIFQRLHQTEAGYAGKGIGLAICQRIMANHDGYILAKGEPHLGATFKLYFPV